MKLEEVYLEQPTQKWPEIIQGGMGAGVSNWELAKSVAQQGQLGVVSGTALDSILVRRLQVGDLNGDVRRALKQYPDQEVVQDILEKFFIEGGKAPEKAFKVIPMPEVEMSKELLNLMIVGNFVEVFLAKEGHDGVVGINYLEKIQVPTLPCIFGAMLAGVDYVLMGAGIPIMIPGILDKFAKWESAGLRVHVEENSVGDEFTQELNPVDFFESDPVGIKRPKFLAIVSSHLVAMTMVRKASGYVDGFVVETPIAGGHNAPPRQRFADGEEPYFGPKDDPIIDKVAALERPFWIAGGFASPERLFEAKEQGAVGIQVGSLFAMCDESGFDREVKEEVFRQFRAGKVDVYTDFYASPTGYPFKVIRTSEEFGFAQNDINRKRVCDLGYLREVYRTAEGTLGYRCASEPIAAYVKKGGTEEGTKRKQCLCNGLMRNIGLGQVRGGKTELPLVTSGQDFSFLSRLLTDDKNSYSAAEAIAFLLAK